MAISISDFVAISVAQPGQALPAYNVNVLGLLTKDAPIQNFGVGGTATATVGGGAVTAVNVGTAGSGYTTPPPVFLVGGGGSGAVVTATIGAGAITGFTVINGGTGYTTAPTVVVGNQFQIYTDPIQVGLDFGTSSETYKIAQTVFSQSPNPISAGGYLLIYAMGATDTLSMAISALTQQNVYCGGFIFGGYQPVTAEIVAAALLVQALTVKAMLYAPTNLITDLYSPGMCYQVSQALYTQTRLLIHTASAQQARLFAAAYAARLQSVDFAGTGTAITMNLKNLVGIPADTAINETIAAQCALVGVDYYAQVATLAEVVSTGGNDYSDNVYNLTALLAALQVSVFNSLATTSTKIPQTENGMNTLKGAFMTVLQQFVQNGFLAPGAWTGQTFGDPVAFIRNIADFGFYIYSIPIAQQSAADRKARKAPTIQIAIKYGGAIQRVLGILYPQP